MQLSDPFIPYELRIHVDEAWRGPLAGPVRVAGVIQTSGDCEISIFGDSKTIIPLQRAKLYQQIVDETSRGTLCFGSWWSSAKEIDLLGIIKSLQLATVRMMVDLLERWYLGVLREKLIQSVRWDDIIFVTVADQLIQDLQLSPKTRQRAMRSAMKFLDIFLHFPQRAFVFKGLIIDGNHTFGLDILLGCRVITVVQWDRKNHLIGAASIVAKVERDLYMEQLECKRKIWFFEKHKGYGTSFHLERIADRKQKLHKEHRRSFLKKFMR